MANVGDKKTMYGRQFVYNGTGWVPVEVYARHGYSDGETIKTVKEIEDMIKIYSNYSQIYGVERRRDVADPTFTTLIGSSELHSRLPLHNNIKNCLVNKSRQVVKYLSPTNWNYDINGNSVLLDGTDGNDVMVEYPECWAIFGGSDPTYERWIVSPGPFVYGNDIAIHINRYVDAADNCTLDRTTGESRCIRSTNSNFAGSGSGATAGGVGYARTSLSRYAYEIAADAKGTKWKASYYRDLMMLMCYMFIEYRTKNLKTIFGNPSNWNSTEWSNYNGYYPVIKILDVQIALSGRSDIVSKGHLTGTADFTFSNGKTTTFHCYRGKSNLWGHLWNWISGIDLEIQADANGGNSNVYLTNNPDLIDANRSNSSFAFKDVYKFAGKATRSSGWIKDIIQDSHVANTVGGAETTYGCAYWWSSIPASGVERRGLICGARLNIGANAALGSVSNDAPSNTSTTLGGGFRADL
jgi:hypothetical protein